MSDLRAGTSPEALRQMADDLSRVHYLLAVRKLGDTVADRLTTERYLEVRRIAGRAEKLLREVADHG